MALYSVFKTVSHSRIIQIEVSAYGDNIIELPVLESIGAVIFGPLRRAMGLHILFSFRER